MKTATGQQAGALRGKDTWSIQVEIDAPLEQCFESALNALKDRGLKEQQSFAQEAAPQAMLTWKRYTVIVTAMDTGNDQCTLWYGAGVDGLRLSG